IPGAVLSGTVLVSQIYCRGMRIRVYTKQKAYLHRRGKPNPRASGSTPPLPDAPSSPDGPVLPDEDLVADLEIVEVLLRVLRREPDTAGGLVVGVALVEGVAVVGEVHGVRHRGVVEEVGHLVLDLAVDPEGAARGLLSRLTRGMVGGAVVLHAVVLQPGAVALEVDADLGVLGARAVVEVVDRRGRSRRGGRCRGRSRTGRPHALGDQPRGGGLEGRVHRAADGG